MCVILTDTWARDTSLPKSHHGCGFSHNLSTEACRESVRALIAVNSVADQLVFFFPPIEGSYLQRDTHQPTKMPPHPDKNHLPAQPGH